MVLICVDCYFCSQYLSELLAEHQKLGPFIQVLPICSRLLNQGRLSQSLIFWIWVFLDFFGFLCFLCATIFFNRITGLVNVLLCVCLDGLLICFSLICAKPCQLISTVIYFDCCNKYPFLIFLLIFWNSDALIVFIVKARS